MTNESPPQEEIETARQVDADVDEETAKDIAFRRLIYGLAGDDVDPDEAGFVEASKVAVHNYEMIKAENKRLRDEVAQLQAQTDMTTDGSETKETKVRDIVQAAENRREGDQAVVMLTARDIVTATGCSRRYAYDLIEDLPEEYVWIWSRRQARKSQFASHEIKADGQTKAIGVHFEGLHNDAVAVNKFTTPKRHQTGGN